jgi:DNA-directed RNA polymerase subunit RPC12/RpoP
VARIVKCADCGGSVSRSAERCPQCGSTRFTAGRKIGQGLSTTLALLVLLGFGVIVFMAVTGRHFF